MNNCRSTQAGSQDARTHHQHQSQLNYYYISILQPIGDGKGAYSDFPALVTVISK